MSNIAYLAVDDEPAILGVVVDGDLRQAVDLLPLRRHCASNPSNLSPV